MIVDWTWGPANIKPRINRNVLPKYNSSQNRLYTFPGTPERSPAEGSENVDLAPDKNQWLVCGVD